jgi:membrane-associated phospholipid phosphatase
MGVHLVAVGFPVLLERAQLRSRPVRVLRDLYPLLWLSVFWPELDLLHQIRIPPAFDTQIAALDLALFGVQGAHINLAWMPRMPYVWFSEAMHVAYGGYYLLIALPALAFVVQRRTAALRDLVFRLMLTYLVCFVVYSLYPVFGPAQTLPRYEGALTHGFFYGLVSAAVSLGDSPGCAFPSSHVAGAVTIAFAAWRWCPRWVGALLWAEALGVLLSTVYTQNHYPVDAVAGLVLGLGLQLLVTPVARMLVRRRHAVPIPAEAC